MTTANPDFRNLRAAVCGGACLIAATVLLLMGMLAQPTAGRTSTGDKGAGGGGYPQEGPIRVLFLGHESEHHNSNLYYPKLAQALGPEAIYFDYVTSAEDALGDAAYLNRFDALMVYANHETITPAQWKNLKAYVENGGGFVPVHCASACFTNEPAYLAMVGGQFANHKTGTFTAKVVAPEHPAMQGVAAFEAWDETYVHKNHNEAGRTVLMVREPAGPEDNITAPEPWTWARTQGKGRVFYTASGHDERAWEQAGFHQLLKSGILWAVGDEVRDRHEAFLKARPELTYEIRDNIPNYEKRPAPLPYQHPLSPEVSLQYTQAPIDFRIELFAAEPDIINPICMAWDERGRLWVAETLDYPNEVRKEGGNDKIKILEDTDGDGRCDNVKIFAEGLNIPTSIAFANGGVIVAQAPHFLFLKDENGDDRADISTVLFSGWGTKDTHAGPSNLRYGFDNWVWGTVGYSGYERKGGDGGGKDERFGMGIFRVRPDGTGLEFLHQFNNNTWGLGFNAAGDAFGSTANNNPSFWGGIRATVYPDGMKGTTAKMIADSRLFHPITPNIRQVDAMGAYTAGCGHALATSDAFPVAWRNTMAFVNGPTGNLTGRYRIERDGAGYKAKNAFAFVASADEWFSPVAAEVGPDGNLWLADWYDFIIQHNPAPVPERGGYAAELGVGNAHVNPNRDKQHGRIYRVIWEKAPKPSITSLAGAGIEELVAALGSENLFWRSTAQRLLVEGKKQEAAPALKGLISQGGPAAIHALWTLEGLGVLDRDTQQLALLSPDKDLKRNAIRTLGSDEEAVQLFFDSAVVADGDGLVRLEAFNKMATFPKTEITTLAATRLVNSPENREDEWLAASLGAAGARLGARPPFDLGENLLPNPSFEEMAEDGRPADWKNVRYKGNGEHSLEEKKARTGKHSVKIGSTEGADASWTTTVAVEPGTDYRLSGWITTTGVSDARGALMNIHGMPSNAGATNGLQKKNDWTEVELIFNSGDRTSVTVNCLFGGWGLSTGTAWWDDVALQKVIYRTETTEAGDPDRGRTIFLEHPIAGCIRCHQVGGAGGPVGPALDGIAVRKDLAYIRESLVDPGAAIAEGFQAEVSPMPPMGVLLKPQELEDVIAYLLTLGE